MEDRLRNAVLLAQLISRESYRFVPLHNISLGIDCHVPAAYLLTDTVRQPYNKPNRIRSMPGALKAPVDRELRQLQCAHHLISDRHTALFSREWQRVHTNCGVRGD